MADSWWQAIMAGGLAFLVVAGIILAAIFHGAGEDDDEAGER